MKQKLLKMLLIPSLGLMTTTAAITAATSCGSKTTTLTLVNGSTKLVGLSSFSYHDVNCWSVPSEYDDDNDYNVSYFLTIDNQKITISSSGCVYWNGGLGKGTYEFKVICLLISENSIKHVLYSPLITLAVIDLPAIKSEQINARWIGHRGAPYHYFESSIESFEYAGNDSNMSGIETDIHPTKDDGVFCCVHDSQCFWNTDKTGRDSICIEDLTYDQIKQKWLIYSNGTTFSDFNNSYPEDQRCENKHYVPPLFEEYLDICYNSKKAAIIEFKNNGYFYGEEGSVWNADNLDKVWNILFDYACNGLDFVLISFDNPLLEYMMSHYSLCPQLTQMLINGSDYGRSYIHTNIDYFINEGYSVDCTDWQMESKNNVDKFHEKQLLTNIYTVNQTDGSLVVKLKWWGVDFISANCTWDDIFH